MDRTKILTALTDYLTIEIKAYPELIEFTYNHDESPRLIPKTVKYGYLLNPIDIIKAA